MTAVTITTTWGSQAQSRKVSGLTMGGASSSIQAEPTSALT